MSIQFMIHYGFHFIVPILIAVFFFKNRWKVVAIIFIATMLVDVDHLFATPIFEANRCSINFHPLHSYIAIGFYAIGAFVKKTQLIAVGLLLHMLADAVDCFMTSCF